MVPHPQHEDVLGGPPAPPEVPIWVPNTVPRARTSTLRPIHVVLFLATLFTTTLAGSFKPGSIRSRTGGCWRAASRSRRRSWASCSSTKWATS